MRFGNHRPFYGGEDVKFLDPKFGLNVDAPRSKETGILRSLSLR